MADSGFGASCHDFRTSSNKDSNQVDSSPPGHVLFSASCRKPDGTYSVANVININSCFANDNGGLVGRAR